MIYIFYHLLMTSRSRGGLGPEGLPPLPVYPLWVLLGVSVPALLVLVAAGLGVLP